MDNRITKKEWDSVINTSKIIQENIYSHYVESGISKEYVKAEVLVPMSENINMTFEIDVPYEFMDEDNTALLEYFVGHIYQPENGSYMTEAVNESITKKERDLQKFQENLDNFDVEAFERGDYDKYFAEHGEEPEEYFESRALFEMAGRIPGEAKIPGKPKKQGLIIAMGSDERNIHHFHVFWNETDRERWKNGACLFLDDNRYYDHGDNNKTLSADELNAVITKLKERYSNERFNGTNWEFLIELWNTNNHRYPIDPNLQMPEYDCKTIIRYKEKSTLYEYHDKPCDLSTTLLGNFDVDFLNTPIDDECYTESAASRAYPVLRQRKKSGLKFTDEELVVIRKIDTEKVGVPNNPLEMVVTDKTRFLPHAIERTEEREMSPDSASVNDIIQASVIMFEQEKSDENDAYYPYLFVGSDDAVVVGVTKRCKLEVDAVITLWNYQEVSRLNKKDMKSKKDLDKVLVEVVKCIPVKKEQN